jgi:hypothetical protein
MSGWGCAPALSMTLTCVIATAEPAAAAAPVNKAANAPQSTANVRAT